VLEEYRVQVVGPLEQWAPGFAAELVGLGFVRPSICNHLRVFAYASRWLDARGLRLWQLTPARVELLLRSRRRDGYTCWISERGVAPLLDYLRGVGVVPSARSRSARTHRELLLARYTEYLVQERGLVVATVRQRVDVAGRFLARHPRATSVRAITAGEIREFFREASRGFKSSSAAFIATALRSLLRFLHVDGRIPASLIGAVPSISGWRLASLPQSLSPAAVRKLLSSCDRTPTGRRDFAVLMLLVRLGLRACEIVRLELDDIDWRRGELIVRGKGKTVSRLPVPKDVGAALSVHMRRRSRSTSRAAFLRCRAPVRPLTTGAVTCIVAAASRRARLPLVGPHKLRHTVASEMLRRGGSLAEIAQVLRHRSLATTAIYAKVDRASLRELVQPWPGGVA
jgi:site-specific recombinase XerD